MRKVLLLFCLALLNHFATKAQSICDPGGNLIIYSNYDGGPLTIDVDVNIPNLKIGVVSYEASHVIITGTYAANVTDVHWAGFNATNDHCGFAGTTVITSTGSNNTTAVMPPVTLSNVNGEPNIIYSYACDNTSSNPGGNTPDQLEHYFLTMFPGSTLRYHKSQYGCWGTNQLMSSGGNCCPTVINLTAQATATQLNCNGDCNATATASAVGGNGSYSYQWTGGPATATWSGLCAGTYLVTVTDGNNATDTQSVTIAEPPLLASTLTQTACDSFVFNGTTYNANGVYYDTLSGVGGCDSVVTLNLTIGTGVNTNVTSNAGTLTAAQGNGTYQWINCNGNVPITGATNQTYTPTTSGSYAAIVSYNGCSDTTNCTPVTVSVNMLPGRDAFTVYPNPAHNEVYIEGADAKGSYRITDQLGRTVTQGALAKDKTTVSLSELSAGLYFLYINESGDPVKLLKQ